MNKSGLKFHVLVLSLLIIAQIYPARNTLAAEQDTRALMDQIFTSLTAVIPLSFNLQEFGSPANRDQVSRDLAKLAKNSDALVEHTKSFEGSYGFVAKSLARDLHDIQRFYDRGATSEARYLLQHVSENCASCHLKLPDPGRAPKLDAFFASTKMQNLGLAEKATLQISLRQFDDALKAYEDFFASHKNAGEVAAMDSLVEYLKVCLRVKSDYERPLKTLQNLSTKPMPEFLARDLKAWQADLRELGPELKRNGHEITRAKKIIAKEQAKMEYPMDRRGVAAFIIASALLNRGLIQKNSSEQAEANFYLGRTEMLLGRSYWLSQVEYYFEAAIRAAPGSKIALKAFDELEQMIIMEYSGSSGMNIPEDVQVNLNELKLLARTKPEKKNK